VRKAAVLLLIVALLTGAFPVPAAAAEISARSAILWNGETGDVLYEKAADERRAIASVTKLLTALVAAEACSGDEIVTVSPEAVGVEGSSLYLAEGETLSVKTLLYGLLLESGNDAAVALACHVSGSVSEFAVRMNEEAQRLGCTDSAFQNPHGLTQEGHYSTARDLARIMQAVLQVQLLREIMATRSITLEGRTFENHNRLLSLYDPATGGKTGYTQAAGRTLVTSAEKNGVTLICVTLDDGDDWNDHIALYEEGFARYSEVEILSENHCWTVPVISGTKDTVSVSGTPLTVCVLQEDRVETCVSLPRFVYAQVKVGETCGFLSVYVNGKERERVWLTFDESVERDEGTSSEGPGQLLSRIKRIIWGIFPLER